MCYNKKEKKGGHQPKLHTDGKSEGKKLDEHSAKDAAIQYCRIAS
jgi:hypothetical protein